MLVRSYSRHSRVIWCDATTETSGQSSRTRCEHRLLVRRIGVGVQQADRDRLDPLGAEVVEDRGQAAQVERPALAAVCASRPGSSRRRQRGTNGGGFT